MQRLLVPGLIIAGLLCLGLGLAWDRLTSSSNYWSPTQAEEYKKAQFELHAKSHHHANESETHEQEFIDAKKRFDAISDQLDRARNSRAYTGTALEVLGALAVIVAAYIQFKSRGSE